MPLVDYRFTRRGGLADVLVERVFQSTLGGVGGKKEETLRYVVPAGGGKAMPFLSSHAKEEALCFEIGGREVVRA